MLWILAEAMLALALLVGIVLWVALPAKKSAVAEPPRPQSPSTEERGES